MQVHFLLKRSYRRFKEERCPGPNGNTRRRVERGQEVQEDENGGIGCSVFLGRSNFSTTHFSLGDFSPNPNQIQIITNRPSPESEERLGLNETDFTVNIHKKTFPKENCSKKQDSLEFNSEERNERNPKDFLMSDTFLENEDN